MSDRSLHASNNPLWKSVDELAEGTGETSEFAPGTTSAALVDSTVSRRSFMALVSASMALTAAACRRPEQKLVPSVKSLQNATPGLPIYYASVYSHRNVAYGAVVKTREGRPIKVTGNASHPSGKSSAANAEMQASLLSLYDPDRIRRAKIKGEQTSYDAAVTKIASAISEASAKGKKVAVLIDEHASPTYTQLLNEFVAAVPNAMVVMAPAICNDGAAAANNAIFGRDAEIVPDLSKATAVVSVDADILGSDKLALYHTIRFSERRRPSKANPEMSHLTVVESQFSATGMNADARHRVAPSQIEPFLEELHAAVVGGAASSNSAVAGAAKRLKAAGGGGVVVAGAHLSAHAHGLAMAINSALGSVGAGKVIDPSVTLPNSGQKGAALADLTSQIEAGNVHAIVCMDVNPEYSASRSLNTAILKNVAFRAAINLYEDETSQIADVSIPAAHWLESWGTAVSPDGTVGVQQPVIAPLCDGIPSMHDTLMNIGKKVNAAFLASTATYADYVKGAIASAYPGTNWVDTLQVGAVAGTTRSSVDVAANLSAVSMLTKGSVPTGTVLLTVASNALYDGRLSNNGWLQELPDPVTKVTWGNVALISPAMAVKLGLAANAEEPKALAKANEKVISITTASGSIELPAMVQPGMADDTIAVSVGYGRSAAGTIGTDVGANAFAVGGVGYHAVKSVSATGERVRIATTQNHHTLGEVPGDTVNERNVARSLTLSELIKLDESLEAEYLKNEAGKPLSIVGDYEYKGHRWGMVIDMSACTGCSSCVVACQSENNIPVVGKEQVLIGREMHWIRLDRYYAGSLQEPSSTILEPMLCQHCENAPCENVCPVAATTHSPEGLNEMTYNRCVGTRYCLNNCPYKVRRFNFLNYKDERQPLDLAFNPEVSGRMRGIMEKCTFCVQRLHEAKWHARDAGRARVMDGEAITACQEACPAGAIIFGDANDASSKVSKARKSERSFHVLAEINTRPQVTYLAKVINDRA